MIYGRLAQLGERLPYKQNVSSSILLSPTKKKASCDPLHAVFFLAFFLFSLRSYNLLHPRSRSFARRFAPSNDVRCGTSSILLSPTIMKASCDPLHAVFFLAFFLFSLRSYNLLHPRSRSFARRFAPSNDVRCGTSSILLSPTIMKASCDPLHAVFFLAFFLFSLRSYNLLHPRSRSFARRFAPSNDVRCGTSSILLSPTIMKASCDPLHAVFFLAFFLFSLQSYNLLHPRLTTFCASLCSFK